MTQLNQGEAPPQEEKWSLLLAIFLSVFAIAPLLYPGYFQLHSAYDPYFNLLDISHKWLALSWLPPSGGEDGIFPYLIAGLLMKSGLAGITAIKAVYMLGWLLGAAGMYLLARQWTGVYGGVLASAVYTYLPYRIQAVYVRGTFGESLFWGLLPIALWAAIARPVKNHLNSIMSGLGTALLWLMIGCTSPGLTLLALPILIGLTFIAYRHMDRRRLIFAGIGIILAGAYIITVERLKFNAPPAFGDHFLYFHQLFSTAWGFGASVKGWNDGLSLQFGFAALALALVGIITRWNNAGRKVIFISSLLFLLYTFMLFEPSQVVWSASHAEALMQYPWQMLGFCGLLLSILAGGFIVEENRAVLWPLFAGAVCVVVLASYNYLEPRFTQFIPQEPPAAVFEQKLLLWEFKLEKVTPLKDAGELPAGEVAAELTADARLKPGAKIRVELLWQPVEPLAKDYKIFLHLRDAQGQNLAQTDVIAGTNIEKTISHWSPGEIVRDGYEITIPASVKEGAVYSLVMGLYDESSQQRLAVPGTADNSLELGVVK